MKRDKQLPEKRIMMNDSEDAVAVGDGKIPWSQTQAPASVSGITGCKKAASILLMLCLVFLPHLSHAATLPDTGQTSCSDASGNSITCPAPGNALAQDGSYVGSQPHFEVRAGGTIVKDLNTDLMWQQADDGVARAWADAGTYCDGLSLGGYDDWRLPAMNELAQLINSEASVPPNFSAFSWDDTIGKGYWSSTTHVTNAGMAFYVEIEGGGIYDQSKGVEYFVRCVRGSSVAPDISDIGDGTAKDETTGLVWQVDGVSGVTRTWAEAITYCENSELAGYKDWRLPDRNELNSIVNYSTKSPAAFGVMNDPANTASYYYWTSSAYAKDKTNAWTVFFDVGSNAYMEKSAPFGGTETRCVRGGPGGSPDPSASLTGVPNATSEKETATITVAGSNTAKYRYKVDSGTFSDPTPITTKIELTGLALGAHTVEVLGINSAGKLQLNPTTATWTVKKSDSSNGSGSDQDGTSPNTDPASPDADTGFTFPAFDSAKYGASAQKELQRVGGSRSVTYQDYTGWETGITDATILTYLKSGNSNNTATGVNMLLAFGPEIERVLSGLINASSAPVLGDHALFTRDTPNLVLRYAISDLRYVKIMNGTAVALPVSTEPFTSSNDDDILVYLRDADGNMVTDYLTGVASLFVWIKDNGRWDANPAEGVVDDPGMLTAVSSTSSGGSDGTGCMMNPSAGFGLEWLMVMLCPLMLALRFRFRQ